MDGWNTFSFFFGARPIFRGNSLVSGIVSYGIKPPPTRAMEKPGCLAGSTISTLLHDKINPKNFQVLSLGDTGFLQFFRVVSRDYGKPRLGYMGWQSYTVIWGLFHKTWNFRIPSLNNQDSMEPDIFFPLFISFFLHKKTLVMIN